MSVSLDQFVRNLIESRLMTAGEVAAFQQELPGSRPRSAEELAQEMVRRDVLTKFQAAAVYQGRTKELVFGQYVVLDKLGAGKMGFVYKARHRELGLIFAVKILPARRVVESPKALARFLREVALHVRLSHPNIVRVHDAGEAHGLPFLVMEFVDGQDFDSLVRHHGPLSPAQAADCIAQTAAGMAYAHGEGIVHRDIKPANLLLDKNGTVKILDLGLGRFDETVLGDETPGGRLTADVQILGTPNYMAPEQAKNPRGADARCDIYSLGCTLFYLLTGRAPFEADTPIRTLLAHRESPIPSLRAERRDVPVALDTLFIKMLAKNPAERYQTMEEVVAVLAPAAASSEADATFDAPLPQDALDLLSPAPSDQSPKPATAEVRPKRTVLAVTGIVLAVALLSMLMIWLLLR